MRWAVGTFFLATATLTTTLITTTTSVPRSVDQSTSASFIAVLLEDEAQLERCAGAAGH